MPGYDIHIPDEFLNTQVVNNFDRLKGYDDIQKGFTVNDDLANFGKGEINKVAGGNIGSTMLAGAARQQGARDVAGYKASHRIGSSVMARMPGNPSSTGVNTLYDRMLQQQLNRVNDRTSDEIVGGLPSYVNNAAQWAEAGNKDRMTQMQGLNSYQQAFGANVRNRESTTMFTKQKSFWDKLKEGVGFAGQIAGLIGGFGGFGSGGAGNGGAPPEGGDGGYG